MACKGYLLAIRLCCAGVVRHSKEKRYAKVAEDFDQEFVCEFVQTGTSPRRREERRRHR